jgi:hypothetical protein
MPNCFQLTRKGEEEPRTLSELDTDLWVLFEGSEPEGNTAWYRSWYDVIGLALACGKELNEVVEMLKGSRLEDVAEFLCTNYNTKAWYEHK